MNIVVLTPIQLFGDGLATYLNDLPDASAIAVMDVSRLRDVLASMEIQIVLVDITQGVDFVDIRAIAVQWPQIPLVALGLVEQRQEVIKCGRAGFASYVSRDTSLEALAQVLSDVAAGRLSCPPEISGGLLRALFHREARVAQEPGLDSALTRRECDVLELLGRGLSNKEIGSELYLSVATVKHHVHRILEKLNLPSRAHAMRRVRDDPWLVYADANPKDRNKRR